MAKVRIVHVLEEVAQRKRLEALETISIRLQKLQLVVQISKFLTKVRTVPRKSGNETYFLTLTNNNSAFTFST